MTAPRDLDRLIAAFLAEGPIELPDRSYDDVRNRIDTTRQRTVIGGWPMPLALTPTWIAAAAAMLVLAAVLGVLAVRGPRVASEAPPSPSAAAVYRWPGPAAAGTYTTNLAWDPLYQFEFLIGDGWQAADTGLFKNGRIGIQFLLVDDVVSDTCSESIAPRTWSGPEAFVGALSALVSVDRTPIATLLKDRAATYFEFTIGPEFGCDPTQVRLVRLPDLRCGDNCGGTGIPWRGVEFPGAAEHNRMWVMEVGTQLVAVDALWTNAATPEELDELQTVIDSSSLVSPGELPDAGSPGAMLPGSYTLASGFPVQIGLDVPDSGLVACSNSPVEQTVCGPPGLDGQYPGVSFLVVDNVVVDACSDQLLDPPVGPSVDHLVAAISTLDRLEVTPPTDVTVSGHPGKELFVRAPSNAPCTLLTWATADRTNGVGAGEINRVRIIDVDGTRILIAAAWFPSGGSSAAPADIEHVFESAQFH